MNARVHDLVSPLSRPRLALPDEIWIIVFTFLRAADYGCRSTVAAYKLSAFDDADEYASDPDQDDA